jgi:hypothetical protein
VSTGSLASFYTGNFKFFTLSVLFVIGRVAISALLPPLPANSPAVNSVTTFSVLFYNQPEIADSKRAYQYPSFLQFKY